MDVHRMNVAEAKICASDSIANSTKRAVSNFSFGNYSRFPFESLSFINFQYNSRWLFWQNYCSAHGLGVWTSTPDDLIGYLQDTFDRTRSLNNVQQSLASIAYNYRLQGTFCVFSRLTMLLSLH